MVLLEMRWVELGALDPRDLSAFLYTLGALFNLYTLIRRGGLIYLLHHHHPCMALYCILVS